MIFNIKFYKQNDSEKNVFVNQIQVCFSVKK